MAMRQREGQTMAIAVFSEWSQAPTDASQRVAESINRRLENKFPAGGLYHAEGPNDDSGWWTFNVWESDDVFQRFNQEILQPALQEASVQPGQVRRLEVNWDTSQLPDQG
jgi:hypothetical protein